MLGVAETPTKSHQEGVPQARDEVPPGQEPGEGERAELQGRQPGARGPQRREEARDVRRVRRGEPVAELRCRSARGSSASTAGAVGAGPGPGRAARVRRGGDLRRRRRPGDLGDIFGDLFNRPRGGGRGPRRAARGQGLESSVDRFDFVSAVKGTSLQLQRGDETVTVRVPPGADEGSRLRIPGQGGAGLGGGPPATCSSPSTSRRTPLQARGRRPPRGPARDPRRGLPGREDPRARRPTAR